MLWDDSLIIGIAGIDTQHRELLKRVDDFMDACMKRQGNEKVEMTLNFLSDYVVEHFNDEQKLHSESKYPKAIEHKMQHDMFVAKLNDLIRKFHNEGNNLNVLLLTNKTLVDWVVQHIRGNDKEFAKFYNKN